MDTMIESPRGVRVGCDIGGTFTDIVLAMPDGRFYVNKTSSTPDDLGRAITTGLQALIDQAGISASDITEIVHGTTTASNTILQRVGARTGVLTTEGFRDVLEIGRIRTPTMFDLAWKKPPPLSPRRFRRGVNERIAADGSIITHLDRSEVKSVVQQMVDEGIESLAICFLNSYINPCHELIARDVISEHFPSLLVSVSYDVLPEMKEYERTSTTVVNAYILPAMRTYLGKLKKDLENMGIRASLQIMASNGGMMGVAAASEKPVFAVASGPAGGVAGAAQVGISSNEHQLIVFDMGGTTAKASIVLDGAPSLTTEYEFRDGISSPSRFIKGGGYVLKVPAIDIAEVGAGGGSLAWIDAGGLLNVGPESAGANPGPACYDRGNDRPTVTDANMVLGYLNPESLAGGSLTVDAKKSELALDNYIAQPLGLDIITAAHGVRQVANVNMARAIRSVTVERGRDPRDMTMVACGGGGPLHAIDVAKLLGIRRIIAPVMAGVFCSVGMLTADAEHHLVRAVVQILGQGDLSIVDDVIDELTSQARNIMLSEGYPTEVVEISISADLRYVGQSSELTVPVVGRFSDPGMVERIRSDFNTLYESTFGYISNESIELVNIRAAASGHSDGRLKFTGIEVDASALMGSNGTRPVSFEANCPPIDTRVISRAQIGSTGQPGPLVIESYDTTIIVPPGCVASADSVGNILIDINTELS